MSRVQSLESEIAELRARIDQVEVRSAAHDARHCAACGRERADQAMAVLHREMAADQDRKRAAIRQRASTPAEARIRIIPVDHVISVRLAGTQKRSTFVLDPSAKSGPRYQLMRAGEFAALLDGNPAIAEHLAAGRIRTEPAPVDEIMSLLLGPTGVEITDEA